MNQCPKTTATIDAARRKSIERSRVAGVARTSASRSGRALTGSDDARGPGRREGRRSRSGGAVRHDSHDAVLDRHRVGLVHAPGHDRELAPGPGPVDPDPSRQRGDLLEGPGLGPDPNAPEAVLEGPVVPGGETGPEGREPRLPVRPPEELDEILRADPVAVGEPGAVVRHDRGAVVRAEA